MNFATTRQVRNASSDKCRNQSSKMAAVKIIATLVVALTMVFVSNMTILKAAEQESINVLFFTESDTTITLVFFYPDGALLDEQEILSHLHQALLDADPTYIGLKPLTVNLANVQVVTVSFSESINPTSFMEAIAAFMNEQTAERVAVSESNEPSPGGGQTAIEEPELVP